MTEQQKAQAILDALVVDQGELNWPVESRAATAATCAPYFGCSDDGEVYVKGRVIAQGTRWAAITLDAPRTTDDLSGSGAAAPYPRGRFLRELASALGIAGPGVQPLAGGQPY